jgi:serine protease Do
MEQGGFPIDARTRVQSCRQAIGMPHGVAGRTCGATEEMGVGTCVFEPFSLAVLGEGKTYLPKRPLGPGGNGLGAPFPINDPFVLRRAVVPVFATDGSGAPIGYGTAFQIDGWGHYLTADHVSDFYRHHWSSLKLKPGDVIPPLSPETTPPGFVLLGAGKVVGTMPIPESAFAPILSVQGILAEQADVMKSLQNIGPDEALVDIAMLHVAVGNEGPRTASLPVRIEGWEPTVGETVLAVGFPGLSFESMDDDALMTFYSEQMAGAYGTIRAVYPNGRGGKDRMAAFEVSADWPSGMSGGPVLNRAGEVVGVVSRSIRADAEHEGVGYAVWLGGNDAFSTLATHLDPTTPGVRGGYGVADMTNPELPGIMAFESTYARAADIAAKAGGHASIHVTLHRLGSSEFQLTKEVCKPEAPVDAHTLTQVLVTSHTEE